MFVVVYFRRLERKTKQRQKTALRGNIVEVELDVSNENETYEQFFSALAETLTTLVQEQLTNFRG